MSNGSTVELLLDNLVPYPQKPCRLRIRRADGPQVEGLYVSHDGSAVTVLEGNAGFEQTRTVIPYEAISLVPGCIEPIV